MGYTNTAATWYRALSYSPFLFANSWRLKLIFWLAFWTNRTVLPQIVYSSYLPHILQTDSSAGYRDGVSLRVTVMIYISLFTTIIMGAAQILSPIGLGEVVRSGRVVNATFAYAPDPSGFGKATFSRDQHALSRGCGGGRYKPCPGAVSTSYRDSYDNP